MSITLIQGKPGAGKSYEAVVYQIIPALKEGRRVITNVPVNKEKIEVCFGKEVSDLLEVYPFSFGEETHFLSDPDDYVSYRDWRNDKGQGCLFVLDECHLLFPSTGRGRNASEMSQKQIKFFSGHRHYGFDFVFMTQSDRKILKLIREDIEICIELRKNRAISDSSYRRYVYYYGEGKKSGLIQQESRKYENQFFDLYRSHTMSDTSVTEASVKDVKKWYQFWTFRFAFMIIPIVIYGVVHSYSVTSPVKNSKTEQTKLGSTNETSGQKYVDPHRSRLFQSDFPYGKFQFSIAGYSDSSYRDSRGVLHIEREVYFDGKNSQNYSIHLNLSDFYLAGYNIAVYGPCMVKLTYDGASKFIYCSLKQNDTDTKKSDVAS